MLRVLFGFLLWTPNQTHPAAAFLIRAPRKKTRRNGAPILLVVPGKIESSGPSAQKSSPRQKKVHY
jgi:hypothetical protein